MSDNGFFRNLAGLANDWVSEKRKTLQGTPKTRAESGGQKPRLNWDGQEISRDELKEIKRIRESGGRSASTIRAYLRGERAVESDAVRRWVRRQIRSKGIGHMAETPDGGQAAEDVRYIDDGQLRRTLVEYIDVPWDWEIGEQDREYALLNTHTGSYNENHSDRQLHMIHEDVTKHVMEALSPSNPETGQRLNLDAQNTHFNVDGWSRELDSVNYEAEYLDPGEDEVYIDNLPDSPRKSYNPAEQPIFEIILWDEDMTELIWHVLGVWTGSSVGEAVILKDNKGWW
jgi:hypothetical protein